MPLGCVRQQQPIAHWAAWAENPQPPTVLCLADATNHALSYRPHPVHIGLLGAQVIVFLSN